MKISLPQSNSITIKPTHSGDEAIELSILAEVVWLSGSANLKWSVWIVNETHEEQFAQGQDTNITSAWKAALASGQEYWEESEMDYSWGAFPTAELNDLMNNYIKTFGNKNNFSAD